MSDKDSLGKQQAWSVKRVWPLLLGLPIIVAIAVGAVLFSGGQERSSQPPAQDRAREPVGEEASRSGGELGHPSLGGEGAPVVMLEYSDFQ